METATFTPETIISEEMAELFGPADAPEAGGAPNEPLTRETARAMGFTDEELRELEEAGVVVDPDKRGPWSPRTLSEAGWILLKRKQLRSEIAERERLHALAVSRLQRADESLARWDEDLKLITIAHLPRKPNGDFAKKSLVIEDVALVKITTTKESLKVEDEAAVLDYIRALVGTPFADELQSLLPAVTATRRLSGTEALNALLATPEQVTVKILATPVKRFVESLPPRVNADTGELVGPTLIPGVEIVPAADKWSWE